MRKRKTYDAGTKACVAQKAIREMPLNLQPMRFSEEEYTRHPFLVVPKMTTYLCPQRRAQIAPCFSGTTHSTFCAA